MGEGKLDRKLLISILKEQRAIQTDEDIKRLTRIIIPKEYKTSSLYTSLKKNVTEIGDSLFEGFDKLEQLTLPDYIERIGHNAFKGCKNLSSINMPQNLREIGNNAFEGCISLTSEENPLEIPSTVKFIGNDAFKGLKYISYSGEAVGANWGAEFNLATVSKDEYDFNDVPSEDVIDEEAQRRTEEQAQKQEADNVKSSGGKGGSFKGQEHGSLGKNKALAGIEMKEAEQELEDTMQERAENTRQALPTKPLTSNPASSYTSTKGTSVTAGTQTNKQLSIDNKTTSLNISKTQPTHADVNNGKEQVNSVSSTDNIDKLKVQCIRQEKLIKKYTEEITKQVNKIAEKDIEIENLTKERDDFKKKAEDFEKEVISKKSLESELQAEKAKVTEYQETIDSLRAEIDEKDEASKTLANEKKDKENEITDHENTIKDLKAKLEANDKFAPFASMLIGAIDKVSESKIAVFSKEKELEKAQEEVRFLKETEEKIKKELKEAKNKAEEANVDLKAVKKDVEAKEKEFAEAKKNFEEEKQQLQEKAKKEAEAKEKEFAEAKKKLEEEKQQLQETVKKEAEAKEKEFAEAKKKLEEEKQQLQENAKKEVEAKEKQIAEEREKLEEERKKLQENAVKEAGEQGKLFSEKLKEANNQKETAEKELKAYKAIYADIDKLYELHQQLPENVRNTLQNLFGKDDSRISIVFNITKSRNIESLWQYICDRIEGNELSEHRDNLIQIFDIAFKLLKVEDCNYERLEVHEGDGFNRISMRLLTSSKQVGSVHKVLLQGFKYLTNNRVLKQSLVSLG